MARLPMPRDVDMEQGLLSSSPEPSESGAGAKRQTDAKLGGGSLLFDYVDETTRANSVAAAHIQIRLGFLRKVFGLLALQLTVTVIFSAIILLTPLVKGFVQGTPSFLMLAFIGSFVLLIAMFAKQRETPTNYILLGIWTFMQAYTVATITTFYDLETVVIGAALTAVVVFSLFLYTLQTTRDFTAIGAGLFALLCIFFVGTMLQLFLMSPMMDFLLSVGGAALFSVYIIFDLQMIMYKMSPEDYIVATISLYLDIVNLFLHILRIVAHMNRQ